MSSENQNEKSENVNDNENSLRVILGENLMEIKLPNIPTPLKVFPLRLLDLSQLEDFVNLPMSDWNLNDNIVFRKLQTNLYIVWLSVRKNPNFTMKFEEFGNLFEIKNILELSQIVLNLLEISGVVVKKEEGTGQ